MIELFVVAICVFFNAFLAAYEIAFVSVARPELRSLAKSGNRHARLLLEFRIKLERTLSSIQIMKLPQLSFKRAYPRSPSSEKNWGIH